MTPRAAPPWLEDLQARFGEVLRTPLDRASGTLTATPAAYPGDARDAVTAGPHTPAEARLAVYNRQYWYRLFTVMQTVFPLVVDLLGAWDFNAHASDFLRAHPPRGWDLERVPDGFEAFFAARVAGHPDAAVLTAAAQLDAGWRALLRQPPAQPFQPSPDEAARLLDGRLRASPSVMLMEDAWGLLERKVALAGPRAEPPSPPPARRPTATWFCIVREAGGVRHVSLEPGEGALLALLRGCSVREALGRLEAACDAPARAALPEATQRWLARGATRGVWCGVDADQRRTQV
ncbi:MAG: DNA-binding domain-containing protein [Polyangiales bacterium]